MLDLKNLTTAVDILAKYSPEAVVSVYYRTVAVRVSVQVSPPDSERLRRLGWECDQNDVSWHYETD